MENIDKLLSIAVPAYNVEKYLNRCLGSICTADDILDDVDVMVINDGSTDRTEKIAQKYEEAFPKTFRLITKENGGHGSAVNMGLKHASGRYFLVLDGDDWLDGQALKKLVKKISEWEDSGPDLISYHYNRVSMETGISTPVKQKNIPYNRICSLEEIPAEDVYFALASICYRTKLLKDMGLRLQEHTYYVDVEYMLLPIPYVNSVLFLDIYLYRYFVGNQEQSIAVQTMAARYKHHERVLRRVILQLSNKPMGEWHRTYVRWILGKILYTHYAIALLYEQDREKGLCQAKKFDSFLYKSNRKLYQDAWDQIPFLRIYRKCSFCEVKVKRAYLYKIYMVCVYKKQSLRIWVSRAWKYIVWQNLRGQ